MVQHLLATLSSVSDTTVANVEADNDVVSTECSLLIRIGQATFIPCVVSPIQSSRRQHAFSHGTPPPTTSTSSPPPCSVSSRVLGSIRSSIITLLSPQHRKNGQILGGESGTHLISTDMASPRTGSDKKRARQSAVGGRPALTLNLLWGRCTLSEFATFAVGDQFIMIIPLDHKNNNKTAISQRKAVRDCSVRKKHCSEPTLIGQCKN